MAKGSSNQDSDSACARLYRMVMKARLIADSGKSQRNGWALLTDTPPADDAAIYAAIGHFCSTISEAKNEIRQHVSDDMEFNLQAYDELAARLPSIGLHNNFNDIFGKTMLQDGTVRGLRVGANLVAAHTPKRVADDVLADLRQSVSELKTSIDLDCPPELQPVLSKCAAILQAAINHYELFGVDNLEVAVNQAYGMLFRNHTVVVPHQRATVIKATWELICKFNAAVAFAKSICCLLPAGVLGLGPLLGDSGDRPLLPPPAMFGSHKDTDARPPSPIGTTTPPSGD